MEKTPMDMIQILPEEEFTFVKEFIDLGENLSLKSKVHFATAHKTWKCVYQRKKPSRVLFTVECTETTWKIKACLWNIELYKEFLSTCSDKIKAIIKNAYHCKSCNNHCKGGVAFTLEEIQYKKCIGCCFYFSNLCKEDCNSLLSLIEKEYEFSNLE